MMDFIDNKLDVKGISFMRIDGSVAGDDRDAAVRRFQAGDVRVALLSIGAASTGITLTRASVMLFFELDWSPAVLKQAEDRIHRIGQKNNADIRYVVASATIDDLVYNCVQRKAALTIDILGD